MAQLQRSIRIVWDYLREVAGENDYARYRTRALGGAGGVMSPKEFYVWQLRQKYSRVSRCC